MVIPWFGLTISTVGGIVYAFSYHNLTLSRRLQRMPRYSCREAIEKSEHGEVHCSLTGVVTPVQEAIMAEVSKSRVVIAQTTEKRRFQVKKHRKAETGEIVAHHEDLTELGEVVVNSVPFALNDGTGAVQVQTSVSELPLKLKGTKTESLGSGQTTINLNINTSVVGSGSAVLGEVERIPISTVKEERVLEVGSSLTIFGVVTRDGNLVAIQYPSNPQFAFYAKADTNHHEVIHDLESSAKTEKWWAFGLLGAGILVGLFEIGFGGRSIRI